MLKVRVACGFIFAFLTLQPVRCSAETSVELWGTTDCRPCREIKQTLREKGIPISTHDLRDPREERYYVKTFGRGSIPVARVGSKVFRGNGAAAAVLRELARRGTNSPLPAEKKVHSPQGPRELAELEESEQNLQRCTNGQVLEDFYEAEQQRLRRRKSADVTDLVLDRCYGAHGKLVCGTEETPFRKLNRSNSAYRVLPTFSDEVVERPGSCKVVNYD